MLAESFQLWKAKLSADIVTCPLGGKINPGWNAVILIFNFSKILFRFHYRSLAFLSFNSSLSIYYFWYQCEWNLFFILGLFNGGIHSCYLYIGLDLVSCDLLNLFIYSKGFVLFSLGISIYKIILPMNKNKFASSFPIWRVFISFSCLISLTRTSSTMLNRGDKHRHHCYVSDLRRKVFGVSSLNMIVVGFFIVYALY